MLPLITMYIFTRCFPRCALCVVDCGMKIVLRIVFHAVNGVSGDGGKAKGIAYGKNFPNCDAGLGTLDDGARSRRTVLKVRSNVEPRSPFGHVAQKTQRLLEAFPITRRFKRCNGRLRTLQNRPRSKSDAL